MNKKTKKIIYLILWVITGILLGILLGGLKELFWLYLGWETQFPQWVYIVTIVFGIAFGLWVGPKAWQKIYVEGARGKQYIAKS